MKKSWIQLGILLVVTFGFVPLVVENFIYEALVGQGFSDLIAGNIVGVLIAVTLLSAGYVTLKSGQNRFWRQVGIRSFDRAHLPFLLKLSLLSFFASVLAFLISVWLGADLENEKSEAVRQSFQLFPLLIAFVGAVVISPLYEEIFYRGMMLSLLKKIFPPRLALFLQALIFALAHLPNWNLLLLSVINGYLFAYAYQKTDSAFAAAFVHGMVNLLIFSVSILLIKPT